MSTLQKQVKNLPDTPGVYIFKHDNDVLYVGKATSLRDRVRSYFVQNLSQTRGPKIVKMLEEATDIDVEETDSALQALILEAKLIKKYHPPYNSREKDNKSYNYIVITQEEFPRVFAVRGRELQTVYDPDEFKYVFGPYPSGKALKAALKIVRKIFPFRGKKQRVAKREKQSRVYEEIGLSPAFSSKKIEAKEYARTINHIRLFFQGHKNKLIKELERDIKSYINNEEFERAQHAQQQVYALTHINDIALLTDDFLEGDKSERNNFRIEAYDVAHTSGIYSVGVMVVVENSYAQKHAYRKFRLRSVGGGDDTGALEEVLIRRLAHNEWQLPRLIVVDGGTAQIRIVEKVLDEAGVDITVVGVVKDEKHRPKEILGMTDVLRTYEQDILLANNEAHRFARQYHDTLRRKII